MRVQRLAAIAAVAIIAVGAAACGGDNKKDSPGGGTTVDPNATGVVAKAQKDKKLIIGVKADQPGLGLQTGSKYEGFDIEIAKIIAKDLGVPESGIEWKTTVSANREPFIQQGTVDLVIATYTINDDRKTKVAFAGPYFVAGQDLLVKSNSSIDGPNALDGKKSVRSPAPRRPSGSRPITRRRSFSSSTPTPSASRRSAPAASTRSPRTTSFSPGMPRRVSTPASSRWSASRSAPSPTASG